MAKRYPFESSVDVIQAMTARPMFSQLSKGCEWWIEMGFCGLITNLVHFALNQRYPMNTASNSYIRSSSRRPEQDRRRSELIGELSSNYYDLSVVSNVFKLFFRISQCSSAIQVFNTTNACVHPKAM